MKSNILVATSVGPGKEYTLQFLPRVLQSFASHVDIVIAWDGVKGDPPPAHLIYERTQEIVMPTWKGGPDDYRYARIAGVRQAALEHFNKGDWSHLYFHDADMIPPADILDKLLQHEHPVVTALYPIRGLSEIVLPLYSKDKGVARYYPENFAEPFATEEEVLSVDGFGQGAMLIRKDIAASTPYRDREFWRSSALSEDYQWCEDSGQKVLIDMGVSAWHVNDDLSCTRVHLGEMRHAAVLIDGPFQLTNSFGLWQRGTPRYDLDEDQVKTLPPGFTTMYTRFMRLDKSKVSEILK